MLDQVGVDDDEDLPEPTETYIEAKAFLGGEAGVGAGAPLIANGEPKDLIEAAGVAKVVTGGENEGDVELSFVLDNELSLALASPMLGIGGGTENPGTFTATLKLDAQNGYEPDELEIKGTSGYTISGEQGLNLNGDDLADLTKSLEGAVFTQDTGDGQGIEVGAKLDLDDPANRFAAMQVLASGADLALPGVPLPAPNPVNAVANLVERFDEDGELSYDTYDMTSESTDAEIKVGLGPCLGAGGGSSTDTQSDRTGEVRPPGGVWGPHQCLQPGG